MNKQIPKKVIFLVPSLVPGGAERVMSFVSQNLNKNKFEVLLLVAGFEKDTAYDIGNVNVKYLNKKRILTAIPHIIFTLVRYKPNIVLSSISHVNRAMSTIAPFFKKIKFIGREATILSKRKNENNKKNKALFRFLPNNFNNLDMIICQSQDMANDMILNYNVSENSICVINNPISNLSKTKTFKADKKKRKYITVGRLAYIKGYDRLLNILSKIEHPFEYTLIGDGSLKEELFDQATKLGIKSNITHIPFTSNVDEYLAQHDIFLQGSHVEGFPNALLESCVVGTPVIAFNAPGGTKEIVEDGVNGFLVDTEEDFLERLNDTRQWDPKVVSDSVYKKFNKEKILKEYETLFTTILKN